MIAMKTHKLLKHTLPLLLLLLSPMAWADKVQPSATMPDGGKPEHVYTMKNGNDVYSNALTAPTQTAENYGLFAFYEAEADGAYYIYSHTAKKWLTYTKAASYSNGKDFVKFSDTKVEGAYFKVTNYAADNYELQPYTTSGTNDKYLNWYQGVGGNPYDGPNTLGLWQDAGAADGGSRYTFTEVVIAERTYTISIPDGHTIKIGNTTYKDGDTYTTEGSVDKADITVVAPEGQFAAVAIDDVKQTINVYFATLPTQPATVAYTQAVVYPAQQEAVGAAKSDEKDGVYTLSNNVLAASYMRLGDAVYFAGSDAMDLVAGTELFTVAFGSGDNVPASAMTLKSLELVDLTANDKAIARLTEVTGAGYQNLLAYRQTGIELKEGQKVEVKVQYKSGSHRLNFGGADLLAANGDIAANDYHSGYSGSQHEKNVFTFIAPNDGTFTIRVIVENKTESIDAASTLSTKIYTAKEGVVINTDIVGIQGRWSRNTTLAKDETWKVASVVGLIAQDGTEADTDIHKTQKRRSFLAYSERERAVPWRAMPMYLTWYELQINRNNAAPGREHLDNTKVDDVLDVMAHWKSDFYDRYGVAPKIFIIDDGWDKYGEWTFHESFPNEMRDMSKVAKEMGAGIGAWLGPVGGYGASGNHRRAYWSDKGGMQLSNPRYYKAFKDAAFNLVCNQDGETGYQQGNDNYVFFKFDGISGQFSSVGPDAGDTGNENAEGIIRLEQYVREELREDIFFNTSVGTWASPFWYQITDATWRQENDHDRTGNNTIKRENWITYRDRLVYQNYVKNSPICPINTLMTHGFILTKYGPPASDERDYLPVRNELRAAFLCGSGMVELYNDYDLMGSINGGALWADLAECIAWQERNADVLPDAHWVGGNPWTGSKAEVYGWAAWNGTKSTLALRNGANDAQTYKFTLRQALNIPKNVSGSIILRSAFGIQPALEGLTEGTPINIDTELTVKLPGSSIYGFEGIDAEATINKVESITLTTENGETSVAANRTLVINAAIAPAKATFPAIAWSSSNPEVATVEGGLVTPVKEGEVTITATATDGSGITASVTLTVTPKVVEPYATNFDKNTNATRTDRFIKNIIFEEEGAEAQT